MDEQPPDQDSENLDCVGSQHHLRRRDAERPAHHLGRGDGLRNDEDRLGIHEAIQGVYPRD